jgi:hypothetical protein
MNVKIEIRNGLDSSHGMLGSRIARINSTLGHIEKKSVWFLAPRFVKIILSKRACFLAFGAPQ